MASIATKEAMPNMAKVGRNVSRKLNDRNIMLPFRDSCIINSLINLFTLLIYFDLDGSDQSINKYCPGPSQSFYLIIFLLQEDFWYRLLPVYSLTIQLLTLCHNHISSHPKFYPMVVLQHLHE